MEIEFKRESVAGCIRRLRNKLEGAGNGMVTIGYADLMVSLDAVETAHVTEIKELKEILDGNNRVHDAVRKSDANRRFELQGELVKKDETIAKLKNGLERAINIICGKCYDKVRAKCARGEKKDCEVFELRKAWEGDSAKLQKSTDGNGCKDFNDKQVTCPYCKKRLVVYQTNSVAPGWFIRCNCGDSSLYFKYKTCDDAIAGHLAYVEWKHNHLKGMKK